MFEIIFQIRDVMIFRIFDAMRKAALPIFPQTLTTPLPIDLGDGTSVSAVINIPDHVFPLSLDESDQVIELSMPEIPLQLVATSGVAGGDTLYETEIAYLLRLPISTDTSDPDRVRVGSDPADFGAGTVSAALSDGHPLEDDAVLLGLLNRIFQALLNDGGFPMTQEIQDAPLPGMPFEISTFIWFNESIQSTDALSARVEPSPVPGPAFRFVVPLEFTASLELPNSETPLNSVNALAEISADVAVLRDLNPGGNTPAQITIRLADAVIELNILQILSGPDITADPALWYAIQDFVRDRVQAVLEDIGDQTIQMLSTDQIIGLLVGLMRDALITDRDDDGEPDFISLWETARDEQIDTVDVAITDDALSIGINGDGGSDIADTEVFIPTNRDFAVRVSGEPLLEEIAILLVTPAEYDDVAGVLRLATITPEGSTNITLRGFESESGTVRAGTRLVIDGFNYRVLADAEISRLDDDDNDPSEGNNRNQAEVSIDTALPEDFSDDTRVRVEFGLGLPITQRLTSLWDFRVNDDVTPSLENGAIRLAGRGRLIRTLPDIGADISLRLGMGWEGTGTVRGGGQIGDSLAIATISETLRSYSEGSLVVVDDDRTVYSVSDDAAAGDTTLELSEPLGQSPDDGAMVSLRWLAIGRVLGASQSDDRLRLGNLTEGAGLIPSGAFLIVSGVRFRIEDDAAIAVAGTATVRLSKRLDDELTSAPDMGDRVTISGGWSGRAIVAQDDALGDTIAIQSISRTIPSGTELTIAGINGTFKVVNPLDNEGNRMEDVEIVGNAAEVLLKNQAVDEIRRLLPELSNDALLWELFGQPPENATVRRRAGGQGTDVRRIGNVDVNLDSPLLEALAAIGGAIAGLVVPGGIFLRGVVAAVVGVILRNVFRNLLKRKANGFDIPDVIDLPIEDQLRGLGVFLSPILNNPIEISPDGLLFAGQATPASAYPETDELRAETMGPFTFTAAEPGQLLGSGPAPATAYRWQTGDGALLNGPSAAHTYIRRGTYVAAYSGLNTRLIAERRTSALARVDVRNVPPVLGVLPQLSGLEGEEIVLTADFTDSAYTDAHRAIVHWGDHSLPEFAELTEILGPPQTTGALTARHRYCDNGEFIVTVIIEDAQGGTERRETRALIENVPPTVEAGPDVFAHPCVPIRLVGHFTDPGWCDTHTGVWDFGDCSAPFPATIEQTNEPYIGRGTATATHCYTDCGVWQVRLTVTDDDGGVGTDSLVVTYSDLKNGSFEDGFARFDLGDVGRHWQPYARPATSVPPPEPVFACESCIVFEGDSAQSIRALGYEYAGLLQSFGANVGWEYQVVARMQITGRTATGWLGIDPEGGDDRAASSIVWRSLAAVEGWQGVSTRAVAAADQVTVFAEVREPGNQSLILDAVAMHAYPCPPQETEPEEPCGQPEDPPDEEVCVLLRELTLTPPFTSPLNFGDFSFELASGGNLTTVTFGAPAGARKLLIPDSDRPNHLIVTPPGMASSATATVSGPPDQLIELRARSAGGALLASDQSTQAGIRELTVTAAGIATLELFSARRGTLHRLCVNNSPGHAGPDEFTAQLPFPQPG
ncbi:hypothetical protein SAMN05444273_101429 [Litoreibacter ascidiaceicola]|uniref:PKD domain-containing protein n=2 Tax=Litoreibacter ascidiaceicola TaxID=1486859 RepID=A0A1M4TIH4_9RHOB|nr:hypothetical protein SAMN05444273_101429 [Litoreibacter ascidiaceicola]